MKDIEAKDQSSLLNEVIHEQNTHGFIVTRIVTDNFPTNSNTFKFFNQGNQLSKKDKHPLGDYRPDIRLLFYPSLFFKNV